MSFASQGWGGGGSGRGDNSQSSSSFTGFGDGSNFTMPVIPPPVQVQGPLATDNGLYGGSQASIDKSNAPAPSFWQQHVIQPLESLKSTLFPSPEQLLQQSNIAPKPFETTQQTLDRVGAARDSLGTANNDLAGSSILSGLSLGLVQPQSLSELPITASERQTQMIGQNLGASGSFGLAQNALSSIPIVGKALSPGSNIIGNWIKSGLPAAALNVAGDQLSTTLQGSSVTDRAKQALTDAGMSYAFHLAHLPADAQSAASYEKAPTLAIQSPKDINTATKSLVDAGQIPVSQTELSSNQIGIKTVDNTTGESKVYKVEATGPSAGTNTRAIGQDIQMPKALSDAQPRYGPGTPKFDSPVDKAAYIVANTKTQSAAHDQFMQFAKDSTGMNEAQVVAHGNDVKAYIKANKDSFAATGKLSVPDQLNHPSNFEAVPSDPSQSGIAAAPEDPKLNNPATVHDVAEVLPNGVPSGETSHVAIPSDQQLASHEATQAQLESKGTGYVSSKGDIVVHDAQGNELGRVGYKDAVQKYGTTNRSELANAVVNGQRENIPGVGSATKNQDRSLSAVTQEYSSLNQGTPQGERSTTQTGSEALAGSLAQRPNDTILSSTGQSEKTGEKNLQTETPATPLSNSQDGNSNASSGKTSGSLSNETVQKQRGFVNTLSKTDKVSADSRQTAANINPQTYTGHNIQEGIAVAEKTVSSNEGTALATVLNESTPWSAEKASLGSVLLNRFSAAGDLAKFEEISNSMDNQARLAGQGNSVLSIYASVEPKNMLKIADLIAAKHGQKLPEEFRTEIITRSSGIKDLPAGSQHQMEATHALIKDIASNIKLTASEWIGAYRYNNMLSGPRTLEKIGLSGVVNTVFTHPATLLGQSFTNQISYFINSARGTSFERSVYYSDLGTYAKTVAMTVPDAFRAAIQSFKAEDIGMSMDANRPGMAIEKARQENIPMWMRAAPASHGAVYTFNKTLIAAGETARLLSHGVDATEAARQGEILGNTLTYRSKPGENPNNSPAVSALESVSQALSNLSSTKGGGVIKIIAPFLRVAVNDMARKIEYSPLNLIDKPSNIDANRVGKALPGGIIMAAGALAASQSQVFLAAPKDKAGSDAFYASGAKPYSVKLGGVYVPLELLGPYALSFIIPAAAMQNFGGSNINRGTIKNIGASAVSTLTYIVDGTPLKSVSDFLKLVQGDSSINLGKFVGSLAGSLIPLEALQRYIATIVDPVQRKATDPSIVKSFTQTIQSGIPGLSSSLPSYNLPNGTPEKRNISDYVSPYSFGKSDPTYGPLFDAKQQVGVENAQAVALLAKGDEAGARAEIAKLPADQQASAFEKASLAAGTINPQSSSQSVAFYTTYKSVRTQSDKVSKQVTALVQNGQLQQAAQTADNYNKTVAGQFNSYTQKYGNPNMQSAKMIKSLQVSYSPSSLKSRSVIRKPISFGQ